MVSTSSLPVLVSYEGAFGKEKWTDYRSNSCSSGSSCDSVMVMRLQTSSNMGEKQFYLGALFGVACLHSGALLPGVLPWIDLL